MKFAPATAPPASAATCVPAPARLTLDQAPFAAHSFAVTFPICGNPCCRCGVVGFECRAEAAPELPPRCFDVDLFKRELSTHTHSAPEGLALGRAFLAEAQETHWAWLCEFFLATKHRQMATMDLDTLAVDLPADVKADPSTMVSYRDLFPWADSLQFTHGGADWFAVDLYCMEPGCACTQIGLACYQPTAGDQPSAQPLECVTFLFHDYVRDKTRVDKAQPGSPAPAALLESLRAAHPDLAGLLRQRHGQLQHLGRRFLSKPVRKGSRAALPLDNATGSWLAQSPSPPAPRALAQPGRNDPCRCGSGKKFKKCCGAARQS